MSHDELISRLHAVTANDLDGILDIESGLREALVAAEHTLTGKDLDLDIESGLRAIIPTPEVAAPAPVTPPRRGKQPEARRSRTKFRGVFAPRVLSLDSASRLALRSHPAINAFAFFLEIANAAANSQALALDETRSRANTLAHTVERALDRALERKRELDDTRNLDRKRRREQAREQARERDRNLARIRALNSAFTQAAALDEALNCGRDVASILAHAHALALDVSLGFDLDLDLDRDLAHDLASASASINAGDRIFVGDLARDLARARHDFTGADLSGVDLSSVSLTGMLWSMATKWPSDEWRAQALLDSRDLGGGTYEIRGGTTNVPLRST